MVQPWTKYMKLGIIHFMLYPNAAKEGKVLETLERIVLDEFFSVVEVTRFPDDATRDKAKQLLQAGQMTVAFGAQPVLLGNKLSLNDLDESRRRQAVDLAAGQRVWRPFPLAVAVLAIVTLCVGWLTVSRTR